MTDTNAADTGSKSRGSGIRTWSLVIGILILLPGAYAFLYFTERDDYLTNRYFRSLSELDRQINQGLLGLDALLEFALVPEIAPEQCKKFNNVCTNYVTYLKQFSEQFAHVKFGKKDECPLRDASSPSLSADKTYFTVNGVPDNRKIITFECPKVECSKCGEGQTCEQAALCEPGKSDRRYISASVSISDLIDPGPALQYFDQVLLLDAKGEVIYRSGKDDLAATENVSARDDYARFENLSYYLQNEVTKDLKIAGSLDKATYDSKTAQRDVSHSTIREATIGKIDYLLFIQPFHPVREQVLRGEEGQKATQSENEQRVEQLTFLVGVVPYEHYFLNIVSLPIWKITNLLLVFLFLLALIPHLKLYFSSRYFMPNRIFAWWLGLTFPLLTLLIWDGWFVWDQHLELRNSMDQEASAISAKLKKNYEKELDAVIRQRSVALDSDIDDLCKGSEPSEKAYPLFGVMFFADRKGEIIGCTTNHRTVDLRTGTSVKKRLYFSVPAYHPEKLFSWVTKGSDGKESSGIPVAKKVSDESADNEASDSANPGQNVAQSQTVRYYSERIQSYDHGLKVTALSFPFDDEKCFGKGGKDARDDKMCVFIKVMQTFFAPVLPYDFGFAVIDDHTGDVYYHSNDQRSLLENFYIETDRNAKLIAAVQSHRSQLVPGIYNGQPHRFYVSPLAGVPWSLVVFYDLSSIEIANLRSLLVSLIYSVLIVLVLLAIGLLTRLMFPASIFKPLKAFLPNGARLANWRSTLKNTGRWWIAENSFDVIYIATPVLAIFVGFGVVAAFTFFDVKEYQIARMQRFNLLHTGRQILKRMNILDLEQQRLGIKPGGKPVGYVDLPVDSSDQLVNNVDDERQAKSFGLLSDFAIYYPRDPTFNQAQAPTASECDPPKENEHKAYMKNIEQGLIPLPVFNRFDATYLQMHYLRATDNSWFFIPSAQEEHPRLCFLDSASGKYFLITSDHPVPHTHAVSEIEHDVQEASEGAKTPSDDGASSRADISEEQPKSIDHGELHEHEGAFISLLFFGLIFLYQLGHLAACRLMGLHLPDPQDWAKDQRAYSEDQPVETLSEETEDEESLIKSNLYKITNGETPQYQELRAILYSRANDRIINTFNVTPVMWLILSGILVNENGLEFRDPKMKRWIKQQPWRQESREFLASHGSDLWRMLAPSFYVLILLAFVLIMMSGGKIGDFLIGIIPIAIAGGIPALTNLVRERLK